MYVDLKTVTAEIDSTAGIEEGRRVAIKYVTTKGDLRYMQISKRKAEKKKGPNPTPKKVAPNMKSKALIPIIDHTDGDKPKDIFMFGIVGFNPAGALSMFYPIKRGNDENL